MQQQEKDAILNDAAAEVAAEPPENDQEQQLIDGLAQSELAGRVKNAAETYNLAQDMEDGLLREIGQECANGLKDDDESRAEWLDMHAFWLSLYMQQDYAENSDAERSWGATESVPILTESCNQFQSRTYKAFFPQDNFVSAVPMRKTREDRAVLEERAKRVGDHMSYQLGYLDRAYKQDKDALFLGVPIHGSFFTKTYFSDRLKRFKVDNVRPTDLVVNYNVGPVRIEDVRRKSHMIYTTVGETEEAVRRGFLVSPCISSMQDGNNVYNIKVDESQGLTEPNSSIKRDRPAILVEQHLYLDLDGNGFRPYIVTFDPARRSVKRMTIGYEADQMGNPLKDYEQTQYFTHYKYRENPDGFYGFGLGQDIGDLNAAINIMLRQSMDAATLANDGNMSGFISERLGLEGDEIRMVLGKLTKIPDQVQDMDSSIMMMKFPGPNDAMLKIMQAMDERAQRMASTTEATTGTMDKVVQPTTYLTQVEQALEPFSSVQMRLASSMTDEFQKIYKINQKYLPLVDYYIVDGAPEMVTRSDYADDMLIAPIFDPKFSTQSQKVARSQAVAQVVMANPLTQTRPQVMDAITKRQLEALDIDNIEELVPELPPPARIDDQNQENMLFMMPSGSAPPFDVFPDQNHAEHLAKLEPFVKSEGGKLMPDQQQAVLAHKQKHEAFLYGQKQGLVPPPRQVGNTSLDARQGDEMGNGQPQSAIPNLAALLAPQIAGAGPSVSGAAASS
jgi:chaperonin GroES